MDKATIEQALETTEQIHDAIYGLIKQWPHLLGEYDWLQYAIGEHDFWMQYGGGDYISCTGNTYSMQTMSNEWFTFDIPVKDVTDWIEEHANGN